MRLYLIRHGRQNSPLCNLDVPLSDAGKRQAELLGKRMAGYPVDVLYTSHLVRAEETGRIAFRGRGSLVEDIQIREGLSEMDFGSLTGVEDSVLKDYYRKYYDKQLHLFREESHRRGGNVAGAAGALCRRVLCPAPGDGVPGGGEWHHGAVPSDAGGAGMDQRLP